MSVATYELGPPKPPPIKHDNGFLDEYGLTEPGWDDYLALSTWELKLEAAEAIQGVPLMPHNHIPDGLAAYRHFLHGGGEDRDFSYERFVADDLSGKIVLKNAVIDVQEGVVKLYKKLAADGPVSIEFDFTGSAIPVGGPDPRFPYPQTENWQKAIGAHFIWMSGTAQVSGTLGGTPNFKVQMTLHAEDRYNFNPHTKDIATGTPDADNGRFEVTGLAKQYMNYSELERDLEWTGTSIGKGPTVTPAKPRRQRQPQDNVRIRNRL